MCNRFDFVRKFECSSVRVPEVGVRSLEWRKMGDLWIRMPVYEVATKAESHNMPDPTMIGRIAGLSDECSLVELVLAT